MIVAALLIITLLIACIALRLTYTAVLRRSPARMLAALSLSGFAYLYGAWIFLSAYAKYAFAISVTLAALGAIIRKARASAKASRTLPYLLLAAVFLLLDVLYFTGTEGRTEYADLAFPMKGGQYYVFQGGKGLPANAFHYNAREAYALDIVKLDALGRRCTQVFSKRLHDYYIFGDTVYSPCSGIVRRAVWNNPDNIPPDRVPGITNLNGVLVEGTDYLVYLGHLRQGGVFVRAGQQVATGQALGLAGNSGMSIEPHLHMQAHKKGTDGRPWYEQPQLYMRFGGRPYLLFEIIGAGNTERH